MVQLIALQTVYVFSQRKEYREGTIFDVSDEREAKSIVAMKKARLAEKPKHVDLPAQIIPKAEEAPGEPKRRGRTPKYLRRDMTATDGPTGEEIPLPSSLQELPQEEPTSISSEEESAS